MALIRVDEKTLRNLLSAIEQKPIIEQLTGDLKAHAEGFIDQVLADLKASLPDAAVEVANTAIETVIPVAAPIAEPLIDPLVHEAVEAAETVVADNAGGILANVEKIFSK